MANLYKFLDYKDYLNTLITERGGKRGFRGQLAARAGCQPAYLSQVLRSHVHLTPEHACNLAHFLGLAELETEYFLLLVDYGRAGSPRLRERLKSQLEKTKRDSENFSKRLKDQAIHSAETQARYYSSWHWGAIHILTSVKDAQTPEAIAERLKLPVDFVMETLRGLKTMGLVNFENDRWLFSGSNLHIPRESPLNSVNHQNWRAKAVQDSQNPSTNGIHYSFCFSLTRADYERIKTLLLELIDAQRSIITPSECEQVACFTYDLFQLTD